MRTETIAKDAPISVNVGYVVKGSQPVNAFSSVNNGALVDYDKKVDAALEKQSEESLGKAFSKGLEDVKRQIARKEIKGHKLGIRQWYCVEYGDLFAINGKTSERHFERSD